MKSVLLSAILLAGLASTASAETVFYSGNPYRPDSALPNDCVNRALAAQCPLTDSGKNDRHAGPSGTIK